MADKKYLSKIVKAGNTLHIKDAEARQEIADIKSSITGAMHFIGTTTTALKDGSTTKTIVIAGADYEAKQGDVAIYGELEFVWNGSKWQEYGSTGSLKALAFKDSASASYTPAGQNAASAVSFSGQTTGDFVTGLNDDAEAPSFKEGAFSQGTLPSYTEGEFTQGTLPSLGDATTANFATAGETSTYDEDSETLTFADATTAAAVTDRGTFNAGTLPTKAADTFSAGTLPTKAADTFNAGKAATVKTAKAITAVGTATAAAQVFSGTQDTITVD